jgi:hypothetical protein
LLFIIATLALLNTMILPDDYTAPTTKAWFPILGRGYCFKPVELSDAFQTLVYNLPTTRTVRTNLATIFAGTAAGTVQHMFGTTCNRADTAILMQYAGAAGSAFLGPEAPFFKNTDKGRIEAGVNGLFTIPFRYRLNTRAATKRENGIVPCNDFRGRLDKHIITLTFDGEFFNLKGVVPDMRSYAQCRRNDTHFTFSSGKTNRNAGTASQHQDFFMAV